MGSEIAPRPKTAEIVSSLYTSIEIEDMETMSPLLVTLPDPHAVSLYSSYDREANHPITAISLSCFPETRHAPFELKSRISFEYDDDKTEAEQIENLRLTLQELLGVHAEIGEDKMFDSRETRNTFFVAIANDLVAKIAVESGRKRYAVLMDTLTYERFMKDEMGVTPDSELVTAPATPEQRYEALRRFAVIWGYAQDAIRQEFATNDISKSRRIRLETPNDQLYMPRSEVFDENDLTFKDVAGYTEIKDELLDLALVTQHPEEAEAIGLEKSSAILLHGEPGTGKTTLLRAFAGEIDAHLVELSVTDIVDKWVGGSARNLDAFFDKLYENDDLTVLLMDEFDALGVDKNKSSTSERTDVIDRLKLLIDNTLRSHPNIILVAATNNLKRIDPALVRPERFKPIEVFPPNEQGRRELLSFFLGKVGMVAFTTSQRSKTLPVLTMSEDINIHELAEKSRGLVGANFSEILDSIKRERLRDYLKTKEMRPITQDDFLKRISAYMLDKD